MIEDLGYGHLIHNLEIPPMISLRELDINFYAFI